MCATLCQCALLTLTLVGCGPDESTGADDAGDGSGAQAGTAADSGSDPRANAGAGGVNGASIAGSGGTDTSALTDQGGLLGDECWTHPDCESGVCWTWSSVDPACLGNMCSLACQTDQDCADAADQIKARKPDDRRILNAGESSAATCESTGCDFSLVFSFHSCA